MNWLWLWSLWMCGWGGGILMASFNKIAWKIFIAIVTLVIYGLLLNEIGTMIVII